MTVTVKIMGVPLNGLKNAQQQIQLPEGATILKMMEALLADQQISLEKALQATSFMVNHRRASRETVLKDGDDVLVLRMLGGG